MRVCVCICMYAYVCVRESTSVSYCTCVNVCARALLCMLLSALVYVRAITCVHMYLPLLQLVCVGASVWWSVLSACVLYAFLHACVLSYLWHALYALSCLSLSKRAGNLNLRHSYRKSVVNRSNINSQCTKLSVETMFHPHLWELSLAFFTIEGWKACALFFTRRKNHNIFC